MASTSIGSSGVTFPDATTQSTAPVNTSANVNSATAVAGTGISITGVTTTGAATHTVTNAGVTSIVAGTGISVSGATGAVTVSTSGGTGVTSLNGNTGALKGMDLISTGTIGAVNTFNISSIPSGYTALKLILNLKISNNSFETRIRCSTNGGSSFATTGYNSSAVFNDGANANANGTGGGFGADSIQYIAAVSGSPVSNYTAYDMTFIEPSNNAVFQLISTAGGSGSGADGNVAYCSYGAYNTTSYVNGLQIYKIGGVNWSGGSWSLYGMKNA